MQISDRILDDLLRNVLRKLLASKKRIAATRGTARELVGVLLTLDRPLARLSRSETRGRAFSSLGEFLWYLSRDNRLDFIRYYISAYACESEDGKTVNGGYGPRIFGQRGHNQLDNVIKLLRDSPGSRRAVIQLFNAEDLGAPRHRDVPCTSTLQFLVRDDKLSLITTMRSNDAYMGLPHDIFCFTTLQEVVARTLGVEVGSYRQFVGSLHLYDRHAVKAQQYIDEGVQATVSMPAMPSGDPWPSIERLLEVESRIRSGEKFDANACGVGDYWADLIRLLQVFAATGDRPKIEALKAKMVFAGYAPYIETRKRRSEPKPDEPPATTAAVPIIVKGR